MIKLQMTGGMNNTITVTEEHAKEIYKQLDALFNPNRDEQLVGRFEADHIATD